jgi:hypothetical protein
MINPNIVYGLRAVVKFAAIAAMKARLLGQMATLKTYLAQNVGATVAAMSVSIIAAAVAAAWWEKNNGGSQADMERAAAEAGAKDAAQAIANWVLKHL